MNIKSLETNAFAFAYLKIKEARDNSDASFYDGRKCHTTIEYVPATETIPAKYWVAGTSIKTLVFDAEKDYHKLLELVVSRLNILEVIGYFCSSEISTAIESFGASLNDLPKSPVESQKVRK